ncbi:hypothetical protein GH808_11425 [Acetobacterium fimetarium]|uniref:Ig-like domain (Group 3) n=1 Tax=Acetobacterium fimetarium TaxID=52691 RepID=A0ABR6WWP2_9FIRM|nr:hypothetical protein [Acetobacterium fimetarium]MBC3805042.1 hypothetical protein [Acetobacterium fimetarium]
MKKLTASILSAMLMLSMVFSSSVFAANDATQASAWDSFVGLFTKATTSETMGVEYAGWVQDVGQTPTDGTYITGPGRLGTPGLSRRLEGFQIKLTGAIPTGASIKYIVHVEDYGWMGNINDTTTWKANGIYAGTKDESKRIEDIKIVLVGADGKTLPGYSVSYAGHVENEGDTAWVSDGASFNNTGKSQRLECLEVKVVQTKADMTAYTAAVAQAKAVDGELFTTTTYAALTKALADNVVTDTDTQVKVDAATTAITTAFNALVPVSDLDAYNAAVTKANAAVKADYTADSYAALTKALADNVVTNDDTQAKVDGAVTAINDAYDALVEVADMTAYDAAVTKAKAAVEADYTADTYAALEKALADNVVTNQDTQAKVDEATKAINDAYDALELVVKVDGATVATAKTIEVAFNTPIADTSKVTFAVKRGAINVTGLTVTWNSDKNKATLTSTTNYTAGDYTIKAAGMTFGVDTATVKVEAQKVGSIEIVGDNVVATAAGASTGIVNYIVKDQYGTDVTKETVAMNLTWTASAGTVTDDNQGKATWNKGSAIVVTGTAIDTVTLTAFDPATTKTAAKKLTAVAASNVNTFGFDGEPVVPTNATRLTSGQNDVVFNYTAADQYGNAVVLLSTDLSQLQFMSTDTAVVDPASAAIVNKKLTFDFKSGIATAKEVTLTAINKNTGATSQVKFTVNPVADASEPTIVPPTTNFGVGASNFKVYLTVADQYGKQLTADEIVTASKANKFQFASTNTAVMTVAAANSVAKDTTGAFIYIAAGGSATSGQSATLSFTVTASGKVATQAFTLVAAKVPAAMTLVPSSTTLTEGAASTLKATFVDQYGDPITTALTYKVKFTSSDTSVAAAPANESLANMVTAGKTVTALSGSAGKSTTMTAELFNDANGNSTLDAGELVDTKTVTYAVTNATGLTYSITDIPKIYGNASLNLDSAYAKEIKVVAKDGSGNTVSIPSSSIVSVTTEDAATAAVGKATSSSAATPSLQDKYVVSGIAGGITGTGVTTKDVKIRALVNTGSDVVTVEKTVTVSKEALVATSIKVLDGNLDANLDGVDDEMTAPSWTFADQAALKAGIDLLADCGNLGQPYVRVYDQFGVAAPALNATTTTKGITLLCNVTADSDFAYGTNDKIAFALVDGGGAANYDSATVKLGVTADKTTFKAGSTFKAVVTTSNGLSKTIDFAVTSATLPASINLVSNTDVSKKGGASVTLGSAPATTKTAWLAPDGTTSFSEGSTMTKLVGDGAATTILAPTTEGNYFVYIVDAKGNISAASDNKVIVDNTLPTISVATVTPGGAPGTDAVLALTANEVATYYYAVLPAASAAPNAAEIIAQTQSIKGTAAYTTAATPQNINVTSLTAATAYKLYVVVVDAAGNESAVTTTAFTAGPAV